MSMDIPGPRPAPPRTIEDVIAMMARRFLSWKLPEDFCPDGGITFKRHFNEHTPRPMVHEPTGTNLLSFEQAQAMVRHMIVGDSTP